MCNYINEQFLSNCYFNIISCQQQKQLKTFDFSWESLQSFPLHSPFKNLFENYNKKKRKILTLSVGKKQLFKNKISLKHTKKIYT